MLLADKIVVIGGGGHSRVVLDTIRAEGFWTIAGIVDEILPIGSSLDGIPVIGRDADLERIFATGIRHAFIAVGAVGQPQIRKKIHQVLLASGYVFPSIVHPRAIVSGAVDFSAGVLIAAGAIVQTGTQIGDHAIINTGAVIEHDCRIEAFAHIASGSVLSGGVVVGNGTHIGAGSSVIESRKIGKMSLIGAGSVVVKDIPARSKAFGNPCRVVEQYP